MYRMYKINKRENKRIQTRTASKSELCYDAKAVKFMYKIK